MSCFEEPKKLCCEVIAESLQEYYDTATNGGEQNSGLLQVNANLLAATPYYGCEDVEFPVPNEPPTSGQMKEYNTRRTLLDDAFDEITEKLLESLQTLNCDPRAKGCCESAAPALVAIALDYLAQLEQVIQAGIPLNENGEFDSTLVDVDTGITCYFTNANSKNSFAEQVEEVVKDFCVAAEGLLDIILCKKDCKPCKPHEKEQCGYPRHEKENPWYVQYHLPKAEEKCSSSSSSEKKEEKKEKKDCKCRKCRDKKERSHRRW